MKLFFLLYKVVIKILAPIPIIGEPMRALDIYRKTKSLEKAGKFEEAQAIQDKAILTLNPKYLGPLLRSKGQDCLYRLKDYEGAIELFESAEIAMDKSAAFYGVSQPDAILSGIAISAVHLGDFDKAIMYRDKFVELYEGLKKYSKRKDSLKWHRETISWLNSAIKSNAQ